MSFVFHIFRKDLRHLWGETVISLALLAAYIWRVPRDWYPKTTEVYFADRYLDPTLTILLLASWWFLIVRLVHSEKLVGDRQFWLTRPYEWKRLLCAKLLFLVAFVHVPLLIAQICLLGFAGFSPYAHWYGLIWLQAMIFFGLLLPAMALAVVTATFGQAILALLGVALFMAGLMTLATLFSDESVGVTSEDAQFLVLIVGCAMIVLLQYSRRQVRISISLIAAMAMTIAALVLGTSYSQYMTHRYLVAKVADDLPVRVGFDLTKPKEPGFDPKQDERKIALEIPVYLSSDWTAGVQIRATQVSIDAGGTHWDSDWKWDGRLLKPGRVRLPLNLEIDRKIYGRMQSRPARVKISVAFMALRNLQHWQEVVREGDFSLREIGRCVLDHEVGDSLKCRAPLLGPQMLVMSVDPAESTCPVSGESVPDNREEKSEVTAATRRYSSFLSSHSDPAEFGFSPVATSSLSFDPPWAYRPDAPLCPGTPIVFQRVEVVRQGRVELEIPELNLADYRRSSRFSFALR